MQTVLVGADLLGTDSVLSLKIAKLFTRSLTGDYGIKSVPQKISEVHVDTKARRTQNRAVRSHSHDYSVFKVGEMVQVYIGADKLERGSWRSLRIALSADHDAVSIAVPGCAGRRMSAAFVDMRAAPLRNPLSLRVQNAIYELDAYTDAVVVLQKPNHEMSPKYESVFSDSANEDRDVCHLSVEQAIRPNNGNWIQIYWSLGDAYYVGGVTAVNCDEQCVVSYGKNEHEALYSYEEN